MLTNRGRHNTADSKALPSEPRGPSDFEASVFAAVRGTLPFSGTAVVGQRETLNTMSRLAAVSILFVVCTATLTLLMRSSPPMNDFETLQGLWKIQSSMTNRQTVHEAATHYLITGNSMKEIVPDFVDDGKLRTTFVLDDSASPKRLTETLDYNGPDGPPDPNPIIIRYLYRLNGDTLVLCSVPMEEFPDEISDEYSIKTLA